MLYINFSSRKNHKNLHIPNLSRRRCRMKRTNFVVKTFTWGSGWKWTKRKWRKKLHLSPLLPCAAIKYQREARNRWHSTFCYTIFFILFCSLVFFTAHNFIYSAILLPVTASPSLWWNVMTKIKKAISIKIDT